MMLRRYHPRPEDSPDEDAPTTEDEQDDGSPATMPTARSAARDESRV